MTTELPTGAWVRTRYHGGFEYGCIERTGGECGYILELPPVGATVHKCVWKLNDLQSRGTFVYTKGA